MKPHKHAELIKAWADGAEIEQMIPKEKGGMGGWYAFDGIWDKSTDYYEYRIKPEPKPEIVKTLHIWFDNEFSEITLTEVTDVPNLGLVFDGETGELKSAKVLK